MTDRDDRRVPVAATLDERHRFLDLVADLAQDALDDGLSPDEAVSALAAVADELEDEHDV